MNPTTMKRLDYKLHDFTRYAWVHERAREAWQPRIGRIVRAWREVELLSVVDGLRPCVLRVAPPEEMDGLRRRLEARGLCVLSLGVVGASSSYAACCTEVRPGEPFLDRVVIGSAEDVAALRGAWACQDQIAIGRLLGYPPCCAAFFEHVWVKEQFIDTTWPMARNTASRSEVEATVCDVDGPPQSNILLRWLGVRAVPHLPCRFDCAATVAQGDRLIELGRAAGFAAEMDWLLEMLGWPVEWSALHGIAEVRTPILKITAMTDATPEKYVVRRRGSSYPDEGAQGLSFPYRRPKQLLITDSKGFQRGLDNPIPSFLPPSPRPDWFFTDNGFASRGAMEVAYRPIVELATATLVGCSGAILDLGCGNGALLEAICRRNPGLTPWGVECDPQKVAHARALFPARSHHFLQGDFFSDGEIWSDAEPYALTLFMPGRLLEVPTAQAERLRERIRNRSQRVLLYAYGDWLTDHGGLAGLAKRASIDLLSKAPQGVSLARIPA
jgi:hypothetical protein